MKYKDLYEGYEGPSGIIITDVVHSEAGDMFISMDDGPLMRVRHPEYELPESWQPNANTH